MYVTTRYVLLLSLTCLQSGQSPICAAVFVLYLSLWQPETANRSVGVTQYHTTLYQKVYNPRAQGSLPWFLWLFLTCSNNVTSQGIRGYVSTINDDTANVMNLGICMLDCAPKTAQRHPKCWCTRGMYNYYTRHCQSRVVQSVDLYSWSKTNRIIHNTDDEGANIWNVR